MPEPYDVPAKGTIEYVYYIMPTGLTEDKWVTMAEARPGDAARAQVHHIIAFIREPGSKWLAGSPVRKAFIPPAGGQDSPDGFLAGYAPGMRPMILEPGHALLLKAGSDVIFQMHYTTNGEAARDITRVGLWFAKEPVEKRVITRGIMVDPRNFAIPAGDPNFEARSSYTFTEDAHVHMLMPHMHVRGKDFEYKLTYPDGSSKILLRVPKYDFNWQLIYRVMEPIPIPKGSRIDCVAHFDNSTRNKYNPDPTRTVYWGDQTWEEMMIGWVDYTVDGQKLALSN